MQNELVDRTEITVRFNEADPLGIVWHGHYIRYFEDGREAFGNKYGIGYLDFYREGFIIPVVSIQCDYKKSLRYGDKLIVETLFEPCDAAKLKFNYRLYNAQTDQLIASGSSLQVFLDKDSSTLQLINPPFFEEWKRKQGLI
ncbi:MAG TPA: acyl-CoA thioesterase [Puia sp.]|nr:acyl-CoA thioesterase [Puia sp.]